MHIQWYHNSSCTSSPKLWSRHPQVLLAVPNWSSITHKEPVGVPNIPEQRRRDARWRQSWRLGRLAAHASPTTIRYRKFACSYTAVRQKCTTVRATSSVLTNNNLLPLTLYISHWSITINTSVAPMIFNCQPSWLAQIKQKCIATRRSGGSVGDFAIVYKTIETGDALDHTTNYRI